jgi:organic radical activating enzyme
MSNNNYIKKVKKVRDELNSVGLGFCAMKWLNQTLYLQTGDNHSCYHPRPHHIPIDELQKDPSALHNTEFKKQQRKIMLEGGRPEECYYCWNIEDLKGEHFSDRMFHSASDWITDEDLNLIKTMPWDKNINPRYLELSFGNGCNFKCGYCAPQASSLWVEEIKKHGNYDISYNQYGIEFLNRKGHFYENEDENPYIEAFWKWWPELKNDLKVLRLTGGEPLMSSNVFKMLELLDKEPAPDLEINMNSNLGVTHNRVTKLSKIICKLLDGKKIKSFRLYTSIDSWGPQAEYMRRGLNCAIWENNLDTFIQTTKCPVNIMITYNILSVAYFRPLLEKIRELRSKYNTVTNQQQMIGFDTPYLKEPPHWMINLLPKEEFGKYIDDDLSYIKTNIKQDSQEIDKFSEHEYEKFKRVRNYFYEGGQKITEDLLKRGRRDFYIFFNEYDSRSFLNFNELFPKYSKFMNLCKSYK